MIPIQVLLLWISSLFFFLAAAVIWKPWLEEKNKLMSAFFVYLLGMAFFHLFLGLGFWKDNINLSHLGFLAAIFGSTYTLKIPFSRLGAKFEKYGFWFVFLIGLAGIFWLFISRHSPSFMLWFGFLYMIFTAGVISGPYFVWQGFKMNNLGLKIKAVGGGISIILFCLVADIFVLWGVSMYISEFFMTLSPIVLMTSVILGRKIYYKTAPGSGEN